MCVCMYVSVSLIFIFFHESCVHKDIQGIHKRLKSLLKKSNEDIDTHNAQFCRGTVVAY